MGKITRKIHKFSRSKSSMSDKSDQWATEKSPVSTSFFPQVATIDPIAKGRCGLRHARGWASPDFTGAIGDSQSHRVLRVGSLIVLKIEMVHLILLWFRHTFRPSTTFIDFLSVLSPFDSWRLLPQTSLVWQFFAPQSYSFVAKSYQPIQ